MLNFSRENLHSSYLMRITTWSILRKIQTMVLYSLIPLYLMKLEIIITQLKNWFRQIRDKSKDGSKDPLKGATYALYKVLSGEGRDILIGTRISDENGYMTFENVEPGTYYFKEVSSPVGKIVAEWTTGDSAESFERKLNIDTSYILCEVSAPEG